MSERGKGSGMSAGVEVGVGITGGGKDVAAVNEMGGLRLVTLGMLDAAGENMSTAVVIC